MLSLTDVSASKFTGLCYLFPTKGTQNIKGHVASLYFIKSHDFWALQSLLELLTSLLSLSPSPLTSSLPTPALLPTRSLYLYNIPYSFHNHKQHQWYSTTNDTIIAQPLKLPTPPPASPSSPKPFSHFLHHHYQHYPPTVTTISTSWPALALYHSTLAITPIVIITTSLCRLLWLPLLSNLSCLEVTTWQFSHLAVNLLTIYSYGSPQINFCWPAHNSG